MAFAFYFALLALWPLLLWPAVRLRGWSRAWLCLVILAGLLAGLHEARQWSGTISAIRLDIPLIAIVLGALYGITALVLLRARWRKTASALAFGLLMAGGGLAVQWIEAGREAARLSEVFKERNALLFAARFRDQDTYDASFNMVEGRPAPFPVGHWEGEGGYFSRVIVNPAGEVWAFFPCDGTECLYRSAAPGLEALDDPVAGRWRVTLAPPAGLPVEVRLTQHGPERLEIEGRGQPTRLTKTPPPIDPAPPPRRLTYLGPFSQVACRGQYAEVRQLWLWQEGNRLYGVGIFATLVAGTHARFVSPILLGEGVRASETWSFQWQRNGRDWSATLSLAGPEATLTIEREGAAADRVMLERRGLFQDEVIALAPLTGKADWDHWFEIVLVGHFTEGQVPAC
ncbi:MAG: hypothetical protein AAF495_21705 [Pseudomonadota bacterium]